MANLTGILGGGAIGKAVVTLELDTRKYLAEMNAAQAGTVASTNAMAASLSKIGTVGLTAIGVIGAVAVKAAIDFDKSFTRIAAISNTSADAIEGMKAEVLALSGETAQSPVELADALYFLSSAGLKASQVMPALEAAAKGSAVGLGTTADVANIVASALNAYSRSGLTAAQATDILVAAVREGRAEPEEFANALGRILPIASTIGVTFDQVAASMAALSNIGLDVNEGVTAMRGVLQAIAAPGKQAAEAMDALGLSAQDLLDAIAEDGIIGALRLLDQAAKEQTNTQAEYNNALRLIVPNIRSLTGVLGLTVQQSSKVDAIFARVLDSTGALSTAFKTTAESDAFQLQQALNQLVVEGTKFGASVLPSVVGSIKTLVPVVESLFRNMDVLLGLFLAFKAGGAAAAAGFTALGAALGPIALLIGGAVTLGRALNDTFYAADQTLQEISGTISSALKPALDEGIITTQQYVDASRALRDGSFEGAEALLVVQNAIVEQQKAEEQELLIREASKNQWEAYQDVLLRGAKAARQAGDGAREGAGGIREISDAAREAMKDFKEGVVESTRVAIGAFKNMNQAFQITPTELRQQLRTAIDIARQFGRDLREILGDPDLTKEQKQALAAMPPEFRRAFAEAGKQAKEQLAEDAVTLSRLNKREWGNFANAAKPEAQAGGRDLGLAMMSGAIRGIASGSPAVQAEVITAVRAAISAGKRAAGATSPSKEMMKLGVDMMSGLANGISDAEQKAIDAVRVAVEKMIEQTERALEKATAPVEKLLDKLKDKASSFRDAISSGFGGFLDLSGAFGLGTGGEISAFVQGQVGSATQLADILEALNRQGAGKGLLSQIAGGGAEAIPFAQMLLQGGPGAIQEINDSLRTIRELSSQTGKALSEHFFGEKIDRVDHRLEQIRDTFEKRLDLLHEDLRELNRLEREGHSHDIVMDGERVAEGTRKQLLRTGARNLSVGLS